MDDRELEMQCEAFPRCLNECSRSPLDDDFVRRFNGLVSEHPHALEWKNENGTTLLEAIYWYLHRALGGKYRLAAFQDLVSQTPQVLTERDEDGLTLLHFIVLYNPTALDIVSLLVQINPDAAKALDQWKRTPLHWACLNNAPLPVIRVLVDAYPPAVQICDCFCDSPLHLACYYGAPLDVIQFLSMQKPHVCLHQNDRGKLPLDIAEVEHGSAHNVVDVLTTMTAAIARVLTKRVSFRGLLPREIFEQVAAYLNSGGRVVAEASLSLSQGEISVLFGRDDIRAEFRGQQI